MPTLVLSVDPVFCGPMSVGTIELIRLLQSRFNFSLSVAKSYVDRCVFDGEAVSIEVASQGEAEETAELVSKLISPARFHARVEG